MPQKFILKYSTVAAAIPPATYLVPGELALNIADGLLYFKKNNGDTLSFIANNSTVVTSMALGYDNIITGSGNFQSSALGVFNNATAPYSLAVGWSNNRSNQTGRPQLTTGEFSTAVGVLNNSAALASTTLGFRNIVYSGSSYSVAIGADVKVGSASVPVVGAMELGYHNPPDIDGLRLTAIRLHRDGFVSWTIKNLAPASIPAGISARGIETATQLMPGGLMYYTKLVTSTNVYSLNTVTVNAGGTGYTVNDTLTLSGGSNSVTTHVLATFKVTAISGSGTVTAVAFIQGGAYTVFPTSPAVTTTGASGNQCTLTVSGNLSTISINLIACYSHNNVLYYKDLGLMSTTAP